MSAEEALAADRAGRIVEAATLYEQVTARSIPPLFLLMNLAVLYWQATDFGFLTAHCLAQQFTSRAAGRFAELFTQAVDMHPESPEPIFWRKYIDWADLGRPFSAEECRSLLPPDGSNLVASLHLFALSRGTECAQEALRLLEACDADQTTRSKYVASVIRGTLKRRRGNHKG